MLAKENTQQRIKIILKFLNSQRKQLHWTQQCSKD